MLFRDLFNLQPEDFILKKLLLFTITLVLMLFAQAQAADVNTVKDIIVKHSIELGVDPAIALSIARTESGFRHEARSAHGAIGVYQLMPSTARRLGVNPYSLSDNIRGGIMYYKQMYKMFGSVELALAAYNAGPGNVKKYNSVPPFQETKRFVNKIMTDYNHLKSDPAIVNARNKQQAAQSVAAVKTNVPVAAPVPVQPTVPKVPAAEEYVTRYIDSDVVDETPVELDVAPQTIAI